MEQVGAEVQACTDDAPCHLALLWNQALSVVSFFNLLVWLGIFVKVSIPSFSSKGSLDKKTAEANGSKTNKKSKASTDQLESALGSAYGSIAFF